MPVQIGAKAHSFSDPTGLLSDCHRRIEMFLGSLQHVADVIDRPLTEEARSALESALRYFRESAPKHTADEEESLFPRLRQIQDPEIENALASLDALEADHHKANTLHGEVDVLGTRCLDERCLPATEAAQFRRQQVGLNLRETHSDRGRSSISGRKTKVIQPPTIGNCE
jgi:hypothetical protein